MLIFYVLFRNSNILQNERNAKVYIEMAMSITVVDVFQ